MSIPNLLDEKLQINAVVRVSGKKVNFVSLQVNQEYGEHHSFSLQLDFDILGKIFMSDPVQHMDMIGEIISIDFQNGNSVGDAYMFRGVITQVSITGSEGKHGYIVLEGSSPTIMLERGKRMDVYSNMTLRSIFEELIKGIDTEYLKTVNEPIFSNKIDFLMQFNETDWDFIRRISFQYGENLFYSGSEILFGQYDEWDTVPLTYDKEITSLRFSSRMLANNFICYHYQAEQDTIHEKQSSNEIENSNTYLNKAAECNNLFTIQKPTKQASSAPVGDPSELDELVKRRKTRTAAQTVYVVGQAKTYKPTIGRLIKLSMPGGMAEVNELGVYRVTKSVHRIDQNHRYSNEFEAVPASLQTMPVSEPKIPVADSVLATVRSNEDPAEQGRIQVDFPFANQYSDIWLRVMSLDAGSSSDVPQNRGMVFVPEKGDQVMIGFQLGDPNRPYVMGSMFHGNNSKGGQADNHIKSIITRSGHTIEFNDSSTAWGIIIKDKNGNEIHLDTNEKSIKMYAPEKISIVSKDIEILAKNQMTLSSEKDTSQSVGGEFTQAIQENSSISVGKNFKMNVDSNMKLNIEKNSELNVMEELVQIVSGNIKTSSGEKIELISQSDMNMKSGTNVYISE